MTILTQRVTATEPARLRPLEWLLIEWPADQSEPSTYVLSTLPEGTQINDLVSAAHQRWRIERDYQDLNQDFGLGHYEGRGWRGFHHHASLSTLDAQPLELDGSGVRAQLHVDVHNGEGAHHAATFAALDEPEFEQFMNGGNPFGSRKWA